MRLRSQKIVTPCSVTPRSNRRSSSKATPRRTRLRLPVTESPVQTKVTTKYCLLRLFPTIIVMLYYWWVLVVPINIVFVTRLASVRKRFVIGVAGVLPKTKL